MRKSLEDVDLTLVLKPFVWCQSFAHEPTQKEALEASGIVRGNPNFLDLGARNGITQDGFDEALLVFIWRADHVWPMHRVGRLEGFPMLAGRNLRAMRPRAGIARYALLIDVLAHVVDVEF